MARLWAAVVQPPFDVVDPRGPCTIKVRCECEQLMDARCGACARPVAVVCVGGRPHLIVDVVVECERRRVSPWCSILSVSAASWCSHARAPIGRVCVGLRLWRDHS